MERLTIDFCGNWVPKALCSVGADELVDDCDGCRDYCMDDCEQCGIQHAFDRLASYEDTGLLPEEIMDGRMLTGWIPVEERLPDNGQIVLITRKCRNKKWYVEQDEFYEDIGFESGADEDITAWMPLPEPYNPPALCEAGKYADNDTLMPAT